SGFGNSDGLRGAADFEGNIDTDSLRGLDREPLAGVFLESGHGYVDFVVPGGQLSDGVVAGGGTCDRVQRSGAHIPGLDRRIGDHCSRRIGDSAGDRAAVALREDSNSGNKQKNNQSHTHTKPPIPTSRTTENSILLTLLRVDGVGVQSLQLIGATYMPGSYLRLCAFMCGLFCLPLLAHHGTSNYSTTAQTVTLSGTVTEFVWSNPHVYVLFDVKDATGNLVHWAGEMNSPGVLKNAGWNKNTLKAGDQITATLRPNKFGTPVGLLSRANMTVNGKPLQIGPEQ